MLQKIYEQMADFYRNIEEEYGTVFGDNFDWEHFHFKFLIYYLVRYGIGCRFYRLPLSCCLSFVS